ncbi:MAG TPA: outer membrane lipoprotein-sorting protein [Blastocatellia bacterium]|nr:outer membrane lipoprotein-sorting protein [Blastocatellia bacterium]
MTSNASHKPLILCHAALLAIVILFAACNHNTNDNANRVAEAPARSAPTIDAAQIIDRTRQLDDSRNSMMKLRARITVENPAEQLTPIPPEVQMTMYRKRAADGSQVMRVDFTAPPTERDLSALITVTPAGEVEGTRYTQSNNSFVSSRGVLSEDSLFGMTLQELVGGQLEKYDWKLLGEESFNQTPAYRLEGRLKPGAESKFNRLVLFVAKENFAAAGAEYYDDHDELMRRMSVDKLAQVNGHWTRMHWTVDNRARQKKIAFETLEARYDQNLSDALFTRDQLKQSATK